LGGSFINGSGALRGEGVHSRLDVIASAAKQSILSLRGTMDCFAPLAMTVFVRGAVASQFRLRHSGMRRQAQTRNLEIPGSMLRIAPE
jgi:hypothetical protein